MKPEDRYTATMPTPSETSSLLSKGSSSLGLAPSLRRQLKAVSGDDGKLQKSEFKVLLLDRGVYVKQAVLEDIFSACDQDGDGSLTVDELLNYIDSFDSDPLSPPFREAVNYTVRKTINDVIWWFALAFHFAAWVGITSFIYKEKGESIRPEWGIIGAWFFFFGAVYFFKLLTDSESSAFDTMLQAKRFLKKSIQKDPTFFDQKAGGDENMDLYELNILLEEQNLYLPKSTLIQIFAQIDSDVSRLLTKDEIVDFARTQNTDPTDKERQLAINKAVVRTWGFWSLLCWLLGSMLFLVAAHLSYAGYTAPPLPKNTYLHLYGMGSVLYWLLAFCMVPMLLDQVTAYLESVDQMGKAFANRSNSMGLNSSAKDQLFQSLNVRKSSKTSNVAEDEGLDATELYDGLIAEGVLIPYDTFLELFKSADVSGDGELQLEEFVKFIENMNVASKNTWQYYLQMAKRLPYATYFFGVAMFFVGGFCYTMGSYVDLVDSAWWYFGGAVCYGMASGKNVFWPIKSHWSHFQEVEVGKAKFRAQLLALGQDSA